MRIRVAATLALFALAAAGCNSGVGTTVPANGDKARGKLLFISGANGKPACGACHTLREAKTKGTIGPNLDAAFGSDRNQGFKESTIRQVVADQIRFAGNYGATGPTMPRNLVTGKDLDDVAAYVAYVAGRKKASVQAAAAPTTTTTTPSGGGASAAGKAAFTANGCSSCHTLTAAGSTGTIGPDLDKLKTYAKNANVPLEDFIRESIVDPNKYIEKGFPKGVMPTTFGSLPKNTLDALVMFLAASAKS